MEISSLGLGPNRSLVACDWPALRCQAGFGPTAPPSAGCPVPKAAPAAGCSSPGPGSAPPLSRGQVLGVPEPPLDLQERMLHPRSQSGAGSSTALMPCFAPPMLPRCPSPVSAADRASSLFASPPPTPGFPPAGGLPDTPRLPTPRLPAVQ